VFQVGSSAADDRDRRKAQSEGATPPARYILGALNNSNFLMKDHATGSWWSQLNGACRAGPKSGERLPAVAAVATTWRRWRELHPETGVIAPDGEDTGYDYDRPAGGPRYAQYLENDKLMGVPQFNERGLRRKAWCVGLSHGGDAMAWPYSALDLLDGPLDDEVGGLPVVVLWEPAHRTAWVYRRQLNDKTLRFAEPTAEAPGGAAMVESTSGSHFDAAGRGLDGPLAGRQLEHAGAIEVLWFAWAVFHANTRLFDAPDIADATRDAA
jgi:hypothetical protein